MNENKKSGSRWTLFAVVLAFVMPIGIAWWMVHVSPPADEALLNHGELIRPPVNLNQADSLAVLGQIPLGPSHWAMLYYTENCASECEQALAKLNGIHQVMGSSFERTQVALLSATPAPGALAKNNLSDAAAYARLSAAVAAGIRAESAADGIVLLDWRGQVMMYFAASHDPAEIKKDLKRLLRASKIK